MYDRKQAQTLLPKVGEHRWERPTVDEGTGHQIYEHQPQRCVVVEVNQEHLWYTVQFENGIRESYKVPKCRPRTGGPAV